jgi:hypothetical protein
VDNEWQPNRAKFRSFANADIEPVEHAGADSYPHFAVTRFGSRQLFQLDRVAFAVLP